MIIDKQAQNISGNYTRFCARIPKPTRNVIENQTDIRQVHCLTDEDTQGRARRARRVRVNVTGICGEITWSWSFPIATSRSQRAAENPLVSLFAVEKTRLTSIHSRSNITTLGATAATFTLDSLRS